MLLLQKVQEVVYVGFARGFVAVRTRGSRLPTAVRS